MQVYVTVTWNSLRHHESGPCCSSGFWVPQSRDESYASLKPALLSVGRRKHRYTSPEPHSRSPAKQKCSDYSPTTAWGRAHSHQVLVLEEVLTQHRFHREEHRRLHRDTSLLSHRPLWFSLSSNDPGAWGRPSRALKGSIQSVLSTATPAAPRR